MFDDSGMDGYDAEEPLAAAPACAPVLAASPAARLTRSPGLAERYAEWCRRISERFAEADLVPDLAEDIGSRRWLRGAGTLLGLSALALAGWPDFAPLEAAPVMAIDDPVRDVATCRTDLAVLFGPEAAADFTRRFEQARGAAVEGLAFWDLYVVALAMRWMAFWAVGYQALGRRDLDEATAQARLADYARLLLA